MDLFTYLGAKNGKFTLPHKSDLFAYLLGKKASDYTYKTYTGTTLSINNTVKAALKLTLKASELSQNRLTGKNLYVNSQDFGGTWNNENDWATDSNTYNGLVVKKRSESWSGISKDIAISSGKTYTFSCYIKSDSARPAALYGSGGTAGITVYKNITTTTSWERYSLTFTAEASGTIQLRVENRSSIANDYTYICGYQLEEGSSATDYEIYCGGIPSPNPSFPETIHTINGNNTITVSNSDNTETNTRIIPLGDIEYCKIGNYEDEFIKATNEEGLVSGKWYIKKNIGKVVWDENITVTYSSERNTLFVSVTNKNQAVTPDKKVMSNYFNGDYTTVSLAQWSNYPNNSIGSRGGGGFIGVKASQFTSADDFKTWLSTHNTTVYYVVETPTYTLLNDTLQEALENYYESYNGQTNITQVPNDLPFIIEAYIAVRK